MKLSRFTLIKLLFSLSVGIGKGNAAVVTTTTVTNTLYDVQARSSNSPQLMMHPGQSGVTLYQVEAIRTAEVVHMPLTTFTQAAPSLSTTVPLIYTVEEGPSHIHNHILPTTIDSHWIMLESETDCTLDMDKNTGECAAEVLRQATLLVQGNPILGGETEKMPITTTDHTAWGGTPTAIATITGVITSGQRVTRPINLANIVVSLSFVLFVTIKI